MLDIKLMPAAEVLNAGQPSGDDIQLETPINLFPEEKNSSASLEIHTATPEGEPVSVSEETTPVVASSPVEIQAPQKIESPKPAVMAVEKVSATPLPPVINQSAPAEIEIQVDTEASVQFNAPVESLVEAKIELETQQNQKKNSPAELTSALSIETPKDGISIKDFENAHKTEPTFRDEVSMFVSEDDVKKNIELEKLAAAIEPVPTAPAPISQSFEFETQPQPSEAQEQERDLSYLFSDGGKTSVSMMISKPIEEAPTPNFTAQNMTASSGSASSDIEVLKSYLSMREQDLSILKAQVQHYRAELRKHQEREKAEEKVRSEFAHQLSLWKEKFEMIERERMLIESKMEKELDTVLKEIRLKNDTIQILEDRLKNGEIEMQKLKERVRIDIRKIRAREKELESRLEILRRDSETLIASRESKIFELKRKLDLLEFNNDVLKEALDAEKYKLDLYRKKEEAVLQTLKQANDALSSDHLGHFPGLKLAEEKEASDQKKGSVPDISDHEVKVA